MITWFAVVVVAVTVAVWSVVFLDRYLASSRTPRTSDAEKWTSVHWIIGLAWAFAVLPSVLGLLQVGRPASQFTASVTTSTQAHLQTAISAVLIFMCCRLILAHIHNAPAGSIWRLGAFLAPWFTIEVLSSLDAGYISGRQFVLYPLIAVALWLSSPPLRVARTIGILGALTAAVSMLAALVSPLALVNGGPAGAGKAIIGHGPFLLAGPYSDANGFALTLALAAPCLLLVQHRPLRYAGLLVIGLALLWAAGRTSLIAAAVGLSIVAIRRDRPRALQGMGGAAIIIGALLVVTTPLLDASPTAFTSRGVIWIMGLAEWRLHHLWFGGGPLYFERSGFVSYLFSFKVIAGHNLMVDVLVRGGLVGLAGIALLLGMVFRQAMRCAHASAFPLAFAVTFTYLSWLEVPLNVTNLGFLGYASWLPLAIIVFAKTELRESPRAEVAAARAVPVIVLARPADA